VLYVDDSADDRFLMERAVARKHAGFRMEMANGMRGAIKYFESRANTVPALLITDYALENFRAPDLLRWLGARSLWAHIPTVIFSSTDSAMSIADCYAAGARSFLSKPHAPGDLTDVVRVIGLCVAARCVTLEPLKALSCYRECRLFELRTHLEEQGERNALLRAQGAKLLGELDMARAEAKESKRRYQYPGKRSTGPPDKA
jgi:CheY-like chemotaxis protein